MNDQFRAEACQVYLEQEIKDRLSRGKTAYQVAKELVPELEQLFEAQVAHGTVEKRAQRIRTKVNSVRTDKVNSVRKVLDNPTDKVNSVRNDTIIPRYRMTEPRRKILLRAEEIGNEIGLSIEDTIHNALDLYTTL